MDNPASVILALSDEFAIRKPGVAVATDPSKAGSLFGMLGIWFPSEIASTGN
jgi:hypothetical protein